MWSLIATVFNANSSSMPKYTRREYQQWHSLSQTSNCYSKIYVRSLMHRPRERDGYLLFLLVFSFLPPTLLLHPFPPPPSRRLPPACFALSWVKEKIFWNLQGDVFKCLWMRWRREQYSCVKSAIKLKVRMQVRRHAAVMEIATIQRRNAIAAPLISQLGGLFFFV